MSASTSASMPSSSHSRIAAASLGYPAWAKSLRRLDGEGVHHLESGRNHSAPDDGRDRFAGAPDIVECGEQHALRGGLRQQLDDDFGHHTEHALGPDHGGHQVVAGRVQRLAAQHQLVPLDGLHGDAEHVVHGQAVLQAVHAAGVLGDVAADAAGELRGRVRGVVEAVVCDGLGNLQVRDTGLDARRAGIRIHLEYAVHLGQGEQNPVGEWSRAAGEPGPGAPRHDRNLVLVADSEHRSYLLHRLGQHNDPRLLPDRGQAVGLEGPECPGLGDDTGGRQARFETFDDARITHGLPGPCNPDIVRPASRGRRSAEPAAAVNPLCCNRIGTGRWEGW